jgi:hypothetical protein
MLPNDHLKVLRMLDEESDPIKLSNICNQNPIIAEDLIEGGYMKATIHKPLAGDISFLNPRLGLNAKVLIQK